MDNLEIQLFSFPAQLGGLGVHDPVVSGHELFQTSRSGNTSLIDALTLYRLIYLSVIRELKKGLCIHANTSGSDSPTDQKLGSFSRNRMPLPGHSWLLRNCLSTSVRRRKSGSYPAALSETSERKGHAYIREPPTPELGVFSAKTTPKVSSRSHPKGHMVLKSRKK